MKRQWLIRVKEGYTMNQYEELEMEIIVFETEDVITTSESRKLGFNDLYIE